MRISDWSSDVCSSDLSYIQISAGTPSKPLLKEVSKEALPVIKAEKSSLQSLMDGGGALLADASQALERVNRTLSNENIENVSAAIARSEEPTSELQSLMRISYAAFCLKKTNMHKL